MIETVRFCARGGGEAAGALALPEDDGAPGIVLVHEWWGLTDDLRLLAQRFADEGLAALAVDLYGGRWTKLDGEALTLSSELDTRTALAILGGAMDFLGDRVGSPRVAMTGFCLGGAMTLAAACNLDGLAAAVPFYGTPKDAYLTFERASCPILGHYAATDPFVDPARVRGIHERAQRAGASFELHFYEAGHAFMRASDPHAYHEPSATSAWARTLAFLRRELGTDS